jgi:hypothetical protein
MVNSIEKETKKAINGLTLIKGPENQGFLLVSLFLILLP